MKLPDGICPWATAAIVMLMLSKHPALSLTLISRQLRLLRLPNHPPSCRLHHLASCGGRTDPCTEHAMRRSRQGQRTRQRNTGKGLRRGRSWMLDSAGIQGQSVSGSSTSSSARSHAMSTVMDTWLPFGRLVGVALPVDMTEDAMRVATAELMPEEIAYSLGLSPAIQLAFLGGRLAIRRALGHRTNSNTANTRAGASARNAVSDGTSAGSLHATSTCGAILHNDSGAPLLPEGLSASISHKRHLAVALVQEPGDRGHLGVDIELPAARRRIDLRRRVLTEKECGDLGGLSGLSEDEDVLLRFSMKEAVYKAVHPVLRRALAFKDVEVHPRNDSSCEIHTTIPGAWGNLSLSAGWVHLPDVLGQPLLLTYCRAIEDTEQ